MTKCIMVYRSDTGTYEIPGAAEIEDWDEVCEASDNVTFYSNLIGWGAYNTVYHCTVRDDEIWYFVE